MADVTIGGLPAHSGLAPASALLEIERDSISERLRIDQVDVTTLANAGALAAKHTAASGDLDDGAVATALTGTLAPGAINIDETRFLTLAHDGGTDGNLDFVKGGGSFRIGVFVAARITITNGPVTVTYTGDFSAAPGFTSPTSLADGTHQLLFGWNGSTIDVYGTPTSSGGSAVESVNGKTGAVVLDATEIDIASLSPANYTPATASIEGHLSGVDDALASGGGGHTIQDEGTPLTQRANLNFTGGGVAASDDSGNDATVVNIPTGVSTTLDTQMVNVKDHGAVGDGTTDDLTAVNAAIAAVNALSGRAILWFPPAPGNYRVTGVLTSVRASVNVLMDAAVEPDFTPAVDTTVWQIGEEGTASENVNHRLRMRRSTGGSAGASVTTSGWRGLYLPNPLFSVIELLDVGSFTIGTTIVGFGMGSWGNTIICGELRSSATCLDIGGAGVGGWFNSNRIIGGAFDNSFLDGSSIETIGIEFRNRDTGSSGNDNVVYGGTFQHNSGAANEGIAIRMDQPNAVNVIGSRFEGMDWIADISGSGDGAAATTIIIPSHTRSIANDPPIRVSGGSNPYLYLPLDRVGKPLQWGGHIFEGAQAVTGTVAGTMVAEDHSGTVLRTTGNVTVPSSAGFNVTLIAGGAHTVTFGGTTSAAMAAGDMMSIVVDDVPNIHAVLTAAADKVAFS